MENQNSVPDQAAVLEGVRAKERFSESLASLAKRLTRRRAVPGSGYGEDLRKSKSGGGAAA